MYVFRLYVFARQCFRIRRERSNNPTTTKKNKKKNTKTHINNKIGQWTIPDDHSPFCFPPIPVCMTELRQHTGKENAAVGGGR